MAFVKNNRKWIVLALISIIIIIGIIWFFNQKKVDSITIDVDNTNSYNVKVSMGPNYSTVIYGNNTSKIKLTSNVFPEKLLNKDIKWVTTNNCATITEDNYISVTSECKFEVYAESKNVKSNVLTFKFTD